MKDKLTFLDYEKAKENNIDPKTVYARFHYYGYDKETATTKPVGDEDYRYWLRIAESRGLSKSAFSYRVNKKKMSYKDAATKRLKRGRKRVRL